jgi:hypothetical protein
MLLASGWPSSSLRIATVRLQGAAFTETPVTAFGTTARGDGARLCLLRLAYLPDFGRHLGWKTSGSAGILPECTQDSLSCYPPQYWQLQSYWCSATNFTPMVPTA